MSEIEYSTTVKWTPTRETVQQLSAYQYNVVYKERIFEFLKKGFVLEKISLLTLPPNETPFSLWLCVA